jgi:hypothetical protein
MKNINGQRHVVELFSTSYMPIPVGLIAAILLITMSVSTHAASIAFSSNIDPNNVQSTINIYEGGTSTIYLVGQNFVDGDLDGGGINFSFSNSLLNVANVAVDTSLWEFFSDNGTIDNGAGNVSGISFNSFQSRSGNLLFASVDVVGVAVGMTSLTLSEYIANPFATGGNPYPNLSFDQTGTITVTAVPLPGAFWLFGTAIGFVGWLRAKLG